MRTSVAIATLFLVALTPTVTLAYERMPAKFNSMPKDETFTKFLFQLRAWVNDDEPKIKEIFAAVDDEYGCRKPFADDCDKDVNPIVRFGQDFDMREKEDQVDPNSDDIDLGKFPDEIVFDTFEKVEINGLEYFCGPSKPILDKSKLWQEHKKKLSGTTNEDEGTLLNESWKVVSGQDIQVRSNPTNYGSVTAKLSSELVYILEDEASTVGTRWYPVELFDGRVGYIEEAALIDLQPSQVCFEKKSGGDWKLIGKRTPN
jgi:hypothetical protein